MGNRVEPIRDKSKIQDIKDLLKKNDNWRDYTLFTLGINFGLRIGDLLRIQIKDVVNSDNKIKNTFEIVEQKTEKRNVIKINCKAQITLNLLFDKTNLSNNKNNYLIFNKRDHSKSISRVQAYKLVRKWCQKIGLTDLDVGTHTLRKTWGYHAHKAGVSIETIQTKFKHNSTSTTRKYLGIEQKDVNEAYDKVCL
ncbi:tyrosine-type recombinase/integrase [Sporohalobacter salinus]|uniref:tyrosine-type recombinase/integrase n=1 Tax=Sporohalobacter salinus TaxID=1494606 RepID=UPI0019618CB7|nr:tyrosine-type recombinase/integrase [Sporohalobacter salinus]MBM7623339.1 integrase [Sporohalobacter salinus]